MEKQTVLPIHTSRPLDSFFKRSRLLADDLFEFTIWIHGWDTKARRPCFSGVAQSVGKTQTRLLYFSCLYCLPYYPKELSNTNCLRLLKPSHMQHVLNHLPFSCHFLAKYGHFGTLIHFLLV